MGWWMTHIDTFFQLFHAKKPNKSFRIHLGDTIHIFRQQRSVWVGQEITSFAVFMLIYHLKLVGGSEKVQNYTELIHGWSLN